MAANVGGQAVIEGVMMRSPKSFAVAVRTPDGGITVREEAWLQGNNHATTTTRYSCPAVLPKLPPLAPP